MRPAQCFEFDMPDVLERKVIVFYRSVSHYIYIPAKKKLISPPCNFNLYFMTSFFVHKYFEQLFRTAD